MKDIYGFEVKAPKSKLIGKFAYITDKESIYFQEWGEIMDYDGEVYYIAIAQGENQVIFDRNQFKVPRRQWLRYHAEEIKRRGIIV